MSPEVKETYLNELNGKSRFFRAFECTYSFYFGNLTKENEEEEILYQKRCNEQLEKEKMEKETGEKDVEAEKDVEKEEEEEKEVQSPVQSSRTDLEKLVGFRL